MGTAVFVLGVYADQEDSFLKCAVFALLMLLKLHHFPERRTLVFSQRFDHFDDVSQLFDGVVLQIFTHLFLELLL